MHAKKNLIRVQVTVNMASVVGKLYLFSTVTDLKVHI